MARLKPVTVIIPNPNLSFILSPMPIISVENLSKSYRLNQFGTCTLTNDLNVWWAKLGDQPNPLLHIGETDHGNYGYGIISLSGKPVATNYL